MGDNAIILCGAQVRWCVALLAGRFAAAAAAAAAAVADAFRFTIIPGSRPFFFF